MWPQVFVSLQVTFAQFARLNLTPQMALFIIELRLGVYLQAWNRRARRQFLFPQQSAR